MELQCLLGLKCKEFTMIAADQMNFVSILVMQNDVKKIHKLSERIMIGVIGDQADATHVLQYLTKHMQLYHMRNQYSLDVSAVAHLARYNMVGGRLAGPGTYMNQVVDLMLAGYDDKDGGQLFYLDSLGTRIQVSHLGIGFGGIMSMSIMDRYYSPDLTEKEAYELLRLCTKEIHQRLVVQLPKFQVNVVSKDGVEELTPLVFKKFNTLE